VNIVLQVTLHAYIYSITVTNKHSDADASFYRHVLRLSQKDSR